MTEIVQDIFRVSERRMEGNLLLSRKLNSFSFFLWEIGCDESWRDGGKKKK